MENTGTLFKEKLYYLFDFDMTLFDTSKGSTIVYQKTFEKFGFQFSLKNVSQYLCEPLIRTFQSAKVGDITYEEFERYFYNLSDKYIPTNCLFFPDAKAVLKTLKSSHKKIAIVTNKNRSTLERILKQFEILNIFDVIIAYGEVSKTKPEPDGILKCLESLGCTDNEKAVYIGDAENDKLAAERANIDYVNVCRNVATSIPDSCQISSLIDLCPDLFINNLIEEKLLIKLKRSNKKKSDNTVSFETYNRNNLLNAIFSTASKYRRRRIDLQTKADIEKKVDMAVSNARPITFAAPFGAYKGWQTDSDGVPDWGEVFNLEYYFGYAQEIAKVYEHGVTVYFTFQDKLMSAISNRPKYVINNYVNIYRELLKYYSQIDKRINFELVSINDLYDKEEDYFIEFVENLFKDIFSVLQDFLDQDSSNVPYKKIIEKFLNGDVSEALDDIHKSKSPILMRLQSGINNYCISGYSEETNHSKETDKEKILRGLVSALMINSIDSLTERRGFNKQRDNIQIVTTPGSLSLLLGSTKQSLASFWTGTGVLIKTLEGYEAALLTQQIWQDIKRGVPVNISGSSVKMAYVVSQVPIDCCISGLCENYKHINVLTPTHY